jgi:hypothetical protein
VTPGESTEEAMELELAECGGGILAVLAVKEGEVTSVHPRVLGSRKR